MKRQRSSEMRMRKKKKKKTEIRKNKIYCPSQPKLLDLVETISSEKVLENYEPPSKIHFEIFLGGNSLENDQATPVDLGSKRYRLIDS